MPIISGTKSVAPASGTLTQTGQSGSAPTTSITVKDGKVQVQYGGIQILDNAGGIQTEIKNSVNNVGNINNHQGLDPVSIDQTLFSTTEDRKLAASYFAGGVGIEKDLAVGGFIYGRIAAANSSTTSTQVHVTTNNQDQTFYPIFTDAGGLLTAGALLYGDNTSPFSGGLTYNAAQGLLNTDKMTVSANTASVSTNTGALTVVGGAGIGKDIWVGGNIYPGTSATNSIGVSTDTWATAYLDEIYSKFVGNTFGNLVLSPNSGVDYPNKGNDGVVDIFGEIRVRGSNPIGTAPVVTNILYVTMDGDDTNDGRSMDPSRACRTISGAVKSPYFQSGTQIRVAPGIYLENNPIRLKPYTSVMGSDIRTTGIEPINKTQDLFHVDSGCYIAFCQFLNGRSGLLPGNDYINGTNRGAYATAFPPLTGGDRIDLFHSPYIQNCTNMSGPWLVDGTMFVPNETIQIPIAVGTGTWEANTTSIVVTMQNLPINGFINVGIRGSSSTYYTRALSSKITYVGTVTSAESLKSIAKPTLYNAYTATDTGATWLYTNARSVELGMSIGGGQQNIGFFNARTLMLANKPFLQAQVASFLNQTYNSGNTFVYNTSSCYRDTGLIVDAIAMDMLYNSSSDSVFSGLQYWNQGNYTGEIGSESTATIAAINTLSYYIRQLSLNSSTTATVTKLINTVTNILTNGVTSVTNKIIYGGLPSTNSTILADAKTIQDNKFTLQNQVVTYVQTKYPNLVFNTATCFRDVGYIIDSVTFDLIAGGNVQSIKSGVYYYGYISTSSVVASELNQTVAAYSYIQNLIGYIVTGQLVTNPYQTIVKQVLSNSISTSDEVNTLQSNIDQITDIIVNGPKIAPAQVPQSLAASTNTNVINAWTILHDNRSFIQAEVLAYVAATITDGSLNFQPQKSYRDAGILVENVAYDICFGGNEKSVESGKAYWNGPISYIAETIQECTAAIDYLCNLIQAVIVNKYCPVLPGVPLIPADDQIINTVLVGGDIAANSINNCFNIINKIIIQGPDVAPPVYKSTGPDSAYVSAEILLQANRKFIQEQTINYINYNLVQPQPLGYLAYNKVKCIRDTGILIDSIAADLLYSSSTFSQSTFAGLQYFTRGATNIAGEVTTTTAAITYLGTLASKIIRNVTSSTDAILGISRYSTGTQITNIQPGTLDDVKILKNEFSIITTILKGTTEGWTDLVIPNGNPSNLINVQNSYALLQANKSYMQQEVLAYIKSPLGLNFNSFTTATCIRDLGYIIDSVSFDLLHGGNRQAIQSGLSYYNQTASDTVIPYETTATIYALNTLTYIITNLLSNLPNTPLQKTIKPITNINVPNTIPSGISQAISTITNIISNGTTGVKYTPITLTASTLTDVINSYKIIVANKEFLIAEVIQSIDNQYNSGAFKYDQNLCYRDTGLIIDAVSQDLLLGGNRKSTEAGLAYWNQGYNYVAGQVSTTTLAISYANSIAKKVIANIPVDVITGTISTQVINTFFANGDSYVAQQAIDRNFGIVNTIIEKGPYAAPPIYAGSGIFALTGINGLDVKIAPLVTYIGTTTNTGTYIIGLNTATIGFGINATIYIGNTLVFPLQKNEVDNLCLVQTGSPNTWDSRKVDPIGGMGGSLVDGGVISDRSPIQSFVYDAYTQLTQGGRGVRITNNGYAQLVSVFTIFGSVGVQVDNGGIASIVNSNANFGDLCLVAKGYGKRSFSGTIYNPPFRSYPFSPGDEGLDQYYPNGFWPDKTGRMEVFVPDLNNRPHISLVMEVVAPDGYQNPFNSTQFADAGLFLYGFLNAQPSTGTIIAGTVNLVDISTTNVYVGNNVYIIDQFGYPYDNFLYLHDEFGNYLTADGVTLATTTTEYVSNPNYKIWYAITGTTVADVNYNSITLNQPLAGGGSFVNNPNYFTLYFSGNSYYTVLSSTVANDPYSPNSNKLSINLDPNYQGPSVSQIAAHKAAMNYLSSITNKIVSNTVITPSIGNYSEQYINNSLSGGSGANSFINLEFGYLTSILTASNINSALSIVPSSIVVKTGTIPSGAGSAITLIKNNLKFLENEIVAYVNNNFASVFTDNQCYRDTGLIVESIAMDVLYGSTSDSTFAGLQYWSQQYSSFATNTLISESTATIAAIAFLGTITQQYVSVDNQRTVSKLFSIINNILTKGPEDISDNLIFGKLPTTDITTVADYQKIQTWKSTLTNQVITFIENNYPALTGYQARCSTDIGLLLDAVTFDLLTGGNVQSYKSGVYYYSYDSAYTVIPKETTATVAAFNLLGTITNALITDTALGNTSLSSYSPYQTKITPVLSDSAPSNYTNFTGAVTSKISTITNLIVNGPPSYSGNYAFYDNLRPQTPTQYAGLSENNIRSWKIITDNKAFIQAEVIAYLNTLVFNQPKCYRDTGLIVDAIAVDLITNGTSDSTFAGLQYWNQAGYTGEITKEISTTTAAIEYLKTRTVSLLSGLPSSTVSKRFNDILNILKNGTSGVTDKIVPSGLASTTATITSAFNTIRANTATLTTQVIQWINSTYPNFVGQYNETTCARDVGYILDSISFDLLHGGNLQSIKSGVYYYNFDGATQIPNELTPTLDAYSYLGTLTTKIVSGTAITSPYQTEVTQITNLTTASSQTISSLSSKLSNITNIIQNGPAVAGSKVPVNVSYAPTNDQLNAWTLLKANRSFIQAEVLAYITAKYPVTFNPSAMTDNQSAKCARDVGLTLQQLIYDLETGGNYNMVYAGLSYWSQPGTYHIVELGEAVTDPTLFPDGTIVNFYQRSYISASGYVFEYVGAGANYGALPQFGKADPIQGRETVQLNSGKVFFTSTDQNGDFRIGPGLVISQATGVISGRTFTQSLFSNLTPFILAIT